MTDQDDPSTIDSADGIWSLDDSAFAKGEPVTTHQLQSLCMAANTLLTRPQQVFAVTLGEDKDADSGTATSTTHKFWAYPGLWIPITPVFPVPKMPTTNKITVKVRISVDQLSNGEGSLLLSVTTSKTSKEGVDYQRVDEASGFQTITFTDLECDSGAFETVQLWVKGAHTSLLGDGTTYGGASGDNEYTVDGAGYDTITATSTTPQNLGVADPVFAVAWKVTNGTGGTDWATSGHYTCLVDNHTSDNPASSFHAITRVPSDGQLIVAPLITGDDHLSWRGQTAAIFKAVGVVLGGVSISVRRST